MWRFGEVLCEWVQIKALFSPTNLTKTSPIFFFFFTWIYRKTTVLPRSFELVAHFQNTAIPNYSSHINTYWYCNRVWQLKVEIVQTQVFHVKEVLVNLWCTLVLKACSLPCVVISTKEHKVPNLNTLPRCDLELRLQWAYHTNHLITFLYWGHSDMLPFACGDLSLACGRQLSGRFVCGGKHQSAASLWQSSLLTLRLTMARSLGFKSRHSASPVIWAL